jgi:hypothetical protein
METKAKNWRFRFKNQYINSVRYTRLPMLCPFGIHFINVLGLLQLNYLVFVGLDIKDVTSTHLQVQVLGLQVPSTAFLVNPALTMIVVAFTN